MDFKVYEGHLVYYPGKWVRNEITGNELEMADAVGGKEPTGTLYNFSNIVAKTPEQLAYIISLNIQKEVGSRSPIFIDRKSFKYTEQLSIPTYSDRLTEIGG